MDNPKIIKQYRVKPGAWLGYFLFGTMNFNFFGDFVSVVPILFTLCGVSAHYTIPKIYACATGRRSVGTKKKSYPPGALGGGFLKLS